MNIDYKAFECGTLKIICGGTKKEAPQIQIPKASVGEITGSFDAISEDQCEQMGREASQILFGNKE